MKDLIERQAAIDAVYKCSDIFAGDMPVMVVKADAYEALAQLPSAEPEIVRCKDCKWKQGAECVRFADVRPFADDFCSRAERRTDEQTD